MNSSTIRFTALVSTLAFLIASVPVLLVHADARDALRATRPSTPTVVTPTPPPALPTPPVTPQSQGGIDNMTTGEVNSGGNQGGNVTTGDENVDVHVINVGPVNSNATQTSNSGGQTNTPSEESSCSTDRRAANPCPIDAPARAR